MKISRENNLMAKISLFVMIIVCYINTEAQEESYVLSVVQYSYDISTKQHNSSGSGTVGFDYMDMARVEVYIGLDEKDESMYTGIACGGIGFDKHLLEAIDEYYYKQSPEWHLPGQSIQTNQILAKRVKDSNGNHEKTLYAVSQILKLDSVSPEEYQKNYEMEVELLSDDNLSAGNWLNNLPFTNFEVPEETRGIPKLFLKKIGNTIYYVTLNSERIVDNSSQEDSHDYDITDLLDKVGIMVPFNYDIKYTNNSGREEILKSIKQDEEFSLLIYSREVFNPYSKQTETVSRLLRGIIHPFSLENDSLKVQFVLLEENFTDDKDAARGYSARSRDLTFAMDDVIEVKAPGSMGEYTYETPEERLIRDPEYNKYKELLESQSVIIRPVRIE